MITADSGVGITGVCWRFSAGEWLRFNNIPAIDGLPRNTAIIHLDSVTVKGIPVSNVRL